jgi:hypothetical protein
MCNGREGWASNPVTGKPSPRAARCLLETGLVSARPANVPEMVAGVGVSLCAYPVTVFPEIANLSPIAVTASVDSLCGEALTASPVVRIGGCGQKLARMSVWLRAPGCATPTLSTASARTVPVAGVRLRADFAVARRGVTTSSACFLAHRHNAAPWCALYRKSAAFGAFPAHGRNENRCSMFP